MVCDGAGALSKTLAVPRRMSISAPGSEVDAVKGNEDMARQARSIIAAVNGMSHDWSPERAASSHDAPRPETCAPHVVHAPVQRRSTRAGMRYSGTGGGGDADADADADARPCGAIDCAPTHCASQRQ